MILLKTKKITGDIVVKTGLHIGSGTDTIEIGGMDNPIIKHPITRDPYIPGSSLKGKMRSLIEWELGNIKKNGGKPCGCGECSVCLVFGNSNSKSTLGPTRIIVRDAFLSKKFKEDSLDNNLPVVEEKHENTINRITAVANPRPIERVVPDARFDLDISYKIIDTDDKGEVDNDNLKKVVLKSLSLLEKDYLGGGGSRGNGKVVFENLKVDGESVALEG